MIVRKSLADPVALELSAVEGRCRGKIREALYPTTIEINRAAIELKARHRTLAVLNASEFLQITLELQNETPKR